MKVPHSQYRFGSCPEARGTMKPEADPRMEIPGTAEDYDLFRIGEYYGRRMFARHRVTGQVWRWSPGVDFGAVPSQPVRVDSIPADAVPCQ